MTRLFSLPLLALATALLALLFIAFAGVRRGMLSGKSRALLLVTAGLVLIGAVPLLIRSLSTPEEHKPNPKPKFDVAVEFSVRQPNAEVVRVPFAVGSGSVNIGCEETRSITLQYPLPPGAEQPSAAAEWVNTNNIEGQTSNVNVQPTAVMAVGSIHGLHRTFLLNCPGGGHGELLLRGQYSVKHELPATPVVIKTLHDVAESGQVFTTAIPPVANSQLVYFNVRISGTTGSNSLEGTLTSAETGGYSLRVTVRNGELPRDIRIVEQTLAMTL